MIWILVAHLAAQTPVTVTYKTQAACTSAAAQLRASAHGVVANCVAHWAEDRKMASRP